MYLLSHAGVKKCRHAITWFGDLSYSKLKIEKTDFHIKCPQCNGDFQRLICFVDGRVAKPPPVKKIAICGECGFKDEPFEDKCPKCKSPYVI